MRRWLPVLAGAALLGCSSKAMMYARARRSSGSIDPVLLSGAMTPAFRDFDGAREQLVRGAAMAGGTVFNASLRTPALEQLEYLREAVRIREPEKTIKAELSRRVPATPGDLCLAADLMHYRSEFARPEKWVLKAKVDEGEWVRMALAESEAPKPWPSRPAAYTNKAVWCAAISGWTKAREIRVDVFPPEKGEGLLVWTRRGAAPKEPENP